MWVANNANVDLLFGGKLQSAYMDPDLPSLVGAKP